MPKPSGVRPPYAADAVIRAFFDRMQKMGDPGSVDVKWLESYNLAGAQPHAMVGLLKWLGIIDDDSKSTGVWARLRTHQQQTLADLVRESYEPVFKAIEIEKANREDIEGAFIHAYQSGDTGRVVRAFLTVCSLAGIDSLALRAAQEPGAKRAAPTKKAAAKKAAPAKAAPGTPKPQVPDPRPPPPAGPSATKTAAAAAVTFNVEIPADWDADRVRERVADVLEAVRAFDKQ